VPNLDNPIIGGASGPSYECQDSFNCYLGTGRPVRYLDSGFASAEPEPATWAMMLIGFLGLGFIARRRANRQVAKAGDLLLA